MEKEKKDMFYYTCRLMKLEWMERSNPSRLNCKFCVIKLGWKTLLGLYILYFLNHVQNTEFYLLFSLYNV